MTPLPPHLEEVRRARAVIFLFDHGWIPRGNWRFEKDGQIHDMSAADLSKHEHIFQNKIFLDE